MYVVSQALARARIFSARHGWLRWSFVALLTVTAGFATHRQLSLVDAERNAWGQTVDVLVATDDLTPDGVIAVEVMQVPLAMVPPAALSTLPDGVRLRQRVSAGEIVTDADITPSPGPAAAAEQGTAVVPIVDPLAQGLVAGLAVRVSSEGIVLAEQATVVGVVDDIAFVAVPEGDAPMVAAAAHVGLASLIFLP